MLDRLLQSDGARVLSTSRSKTGTIHFVLEDERTWSNLPDAVDGTFITLPLNNPRLARAFASQVVSGLGKVVLMGTTSAFRIREDHQVIHEDSELDEDNLRNRAESQLIDAGAIGVHAAGIYGPGRSPLEWIRDGRVTPNDRFVNFIHVNDLARVLVQAMSRGQPGMRYLASDGQPKRWSEIIAQLEDGYGIQSGAAKPSNRPSKRIDPTWSLKTLGVALQYSNVIDGIQAIHGRSVH